MSKKAKKVRNYRATDSTMINVGASKKRDTVQNARIAALEKRVSKLELVCFGRATIVGTTITYHEPAKRKAAKRR